MRTVLLRFILKVAMIAAMSMLVACGGENGASAKDDGSSSSVAEKESSSAAKGSSSSAKEGSSSAKATSSSSAKYVCDIYTLSDALSCKCDEDRLGKLAYNYDSKVELECIYDKDLNKYGWLTKKEESSSSSNKNSSSSVMSSSSGVAESSSSEDVVESSSSGISEGWNWDVPKEARLNPEIEYGTMTDDRDGQTYKTVTIGTQTWMAENLNYADSVNTPILRWESWCYDYEPDKCAVTGRLYTWAAAIDSVALANDADNPQTCGNGNTCDRLSADALAANPIQGVCPSGWHLPSLAEWDALLTTAGGSSTAAKALKSTSGWYNKSNGTDAFGFSALPAGYRRYDGRYGHNDGSFSDAGGLAYFWSASQYEYRSNNAYYMNLTDWRESASLYDGNKDNGGSVRCLKD